MDDLPEQVTSAKHIDNNISDWVTFSKAEYRNTSAGVVCLFYAVKENIAA